MEKQRITFRYKSGRRFLISFILFFQIFLLSAQSLSLRQIKELRIKPEENQSLYTKSDIKFTVTIPHIRPSQIQVISTEQQSDMSFRTMRKSENYDVAGTTLELWYLFEKKGTYNPAPISVLIQNKSREIAFDPLTVTDDPAKMSPRIVIEFENGKRVYSDGGDEGFLTSPLMDVPVGKKINFTVNLQYATQLVKFNWDIPQDSIFTQSEEYEFTEVKYRERIYTHDLIPVASFEWTGLKEGIEPIPKFRMSATGYNGYRNELILPVININFIDQEKIESTESESDIFSEAFFYEKKASDLSGSTKLSEADCKKLADLYSKERTSFFKYFEAKRERIVFEDSCGLPSEHSKVFPAVFLYLSIIAILLCLSGFIFSKVKKYKIRVLIFLILLITAFIAFVYSYIRRCEQYGICKDCRI